MQKYKLPNTNCKTCYGTHVNVHSKPVSRLEECIDCKKYPYPADAVIDVAMNHMGEVLLINKPLETEMEVKNIKNKKMIIKEE